MESNPLDERDVAGVRLSRSVYMHFTAQEIRDLKEVFDFFDHKRRGFDIIYYSINNIHYFVILETLNQEKLSMQ